MMKYRIAGISTPAVGAEGIILLPPRLGGAGQLNYRTNQIMKHTNNEFVIRVHEFDSNTYNRSNRKYVFEKTVDDIVRRVGPIEIDSIEPYTHIINFEQNPYNIRDHEFVIPALYHSNTLYITESGEIFIKNSDGKWVYLATEMEPYWETLGVTSEIRNEINMYHSISNI